MISPQTRCLPCGIGRPRDYFDVNTLLGRYEPDRLIELAAAKDSGFTPAAFVDSLRAITRPGPTDWAEDGVSSNDVEPLRYQFNSWRKQLMRSDADSESSAE